MVWAPDYLNFELTKKYMNIQHEEDDPFIESWITTVSRNVDDFCNRQFGQVDSLEERTYQPVWFADLCKTIIEIDDLEDVTGFELFDSDGNEITDYEFGPENAVKKGKVFTEVSVDTRYYSKMTANGLWGRSTVPSSVVTAGYIQAKRVGARRSSPLGVAGSPNTGSEIRLLAKLDPDFQIALKPFVRNWYLR